MAKMLRVCAACGAEASRMNKCSKCAAVFYCNRGCQQTHWPTHKVTCGKTKSIHDAFMRPVQEDAPPKRDPELAVSSESVRAALKKAGLPAREDDWSAERVEALLDGTLLPFVTNVLGKSPLGSWGTPLRILSLLVLRTGAKPSAKLIEALEKDDGQLIPPPPSSFPVVQARIGASLDAGGFYVPFPSGHPLRGTMNSNEATILELLRQRADDGRARWPRQDDLGLGGDGHGAIPELDRAMRSLCGVRNATPCYKLVT